MSSLAIIGGTGLYQLGEGRREIISTPYGEAVITHINFSNTEVVFLARHGVDHSLPPHRINYRANIWALHSLGIHDVLATQAVGSLNRLLTPGSWSLLFAIYRLDTWA